MAEVALDAGLDRNLDIPEMGEKARALSPIEYKTQTLLTILFDWLGVPDFYAGNYLTGFAKLASSYVIGGRLGMIVKSALAAYSLSQLSSGQYTDGQGRVIRQAVQLKKEEMSSCDQKTALFFSLFAGWAGIHQFYAGKPLKGLLMLCTGGGFIIWNIMNIYQLATCGFKDGQGKTICPDYIKQAATA